MTLEQSLGAVADPTRRAICQRLAHGRATVGQLAALFPISRPAVSQHLRILRDAGLVRPSGENRQSSCELVPGPFLEIEAWARTLVASWQGAPLPGPRTARSAPTRKAGR